MSTLTAPAMHERAAMSRPLVFQYNDGGRAAAGYRGRVRDCATRAIAS